MKITILTIPALDPGDVSWDGYCHYGDVQVIRCPMVPGNAFVIDALKDSDVALMGQTMLNREVLDACPKLKFINLSSTGYDWLSKEFLEYAKQRGVTICNLALYGTTAVAQHTFALLLELCNCVGYHNQQVHGGRWIMCEETVVLETPMVELMGQTLGIIGFGKIGQAVAKIAKVFGMNVLACSTRSAPEGAGLVEYVTLEELCRRSDVISLHCPHKPETDQIINRHSISLMKDGALLLNTARGALLNEADVADALNSGKLGGAAVDVVSKEPILESNALLTAKNCILTPHVGWMAQQTRQRMIDESVGNFVAYLENVPVNVINN